MENCSKAFPEQRLWVFFILLSFDPGKVNQGDFSGAPYSHDLSLLAKQAGISLTSDLVAEFNTVSTFNIAGRYDDEKRKFHKIATKDYAEKYLNITKDLISWLKKDYPTK